MSPSLLVVYYMIYGTLSIVLSSDYFIDNHTNCNNVYNATFPGNSTDFVIYLGEFQDTNSCINACLEYGNSNNKPCETYTYYTKDFKGTNCTSPMNSTLFRLQCFGRFGYPLWLPINKPNINCGRIIWPCQTNMDCSLNGKCNKQNGKCECIPSWKGYHCEELNLLPVNKSSGYNGLLNKENITSSWGGVPIIDRNSNDPLTKYHMIISEFVNHCGVDSWVRNSQIIQAQSSNGWNSKYNKIKILQLPFAHEPDVIYDESNNLYVMYYTHFNYSQESWNNLTFCNCSDGSTNNNLCNNKHDNIPYNPYYITSMITSKSIYGPWSDPINILNISWNEPNGTHDNNFAAIINKNGSLIGMKRNWIHWNNIHGSDIHLVLADDYMNNKTYKVNPDSLFPELTQSFTEDPYLYLDCNNNYHAIFHNMDPLNNKQEPGGHGFSKDGINWIYGGIAYNNIIEFDDDSSIAAQRRERPHFLFSDDDHCTIIGISWGVVEGYTGEYGDACHTLIQPVSRYNN